MSVLYIRDESGNFYPITTIKGTNGYTPVIDAGSGHWFINGVDTGYSAVAVVDSLSTVSFTTASTKANIGSGETLAIVFGKLSKWYTSFGTLAWKSTVDYSTEITNLPIIPDQLSDLAADSTHRVVTDVEKSYWNGKADLTAGKVPASQLPSYVDDVVDSYIVSGATELTSGWLSTTDGGSALNPEVSKVYIVLTAGAYQNKTYRWSGSTYVIIGNDLALGTTSSTAYRGDYGNTAYTHSQIVNGDNPHMTTFANLATKPTTLGGYGITDAVPSSHIGAGGNAHSDVSTTVAGFMSAADKIILDFFTGYNPVTTLVSIPVTKSTVVATLSGDSTLSLAATLSDGLSITIICYNSTGSPITITLPATGSYISRRPNSATTITSIVLAATCYCEISVLAANSIYYLKTDA